MEFPLTAVETDVFETVLAAVAGSDDPAVKGATVRVAGGWVRDKLLGRPSDDLDLVVDTCSGLVLAQAVNAYLATVLHEEHLGHIGVIERRPDQSKHLETAAFKVHGHEVDVTQLRSETYANHSRIPEIVVGTPLEDARRRDLTINSLFYNLHTRCVEDFDGRGRSDLKSGLIRTPIEPLATFRDDPLRVLRAIRFAGRFEFAVDPLLEEAAQHSEIKTHFDSKISRERIGDELTKMFKIGNALHSLRLIYNWGYFPLVFEVPRELSLSETVLKQASDEAMGILNRVWNVIQTRSLDVEQRRRLLLSAACAPFHHLKYMGGKCKNKALAVVQFIISESLKLRNIDVSNTLTITAQAPRLQQLLSSLSKPIKNIEEWNDEARITLGRILVSSESLWEDVLILTSCLPSESFDQWFETVNSLGHLVSSSPLRNCSEWKPLLSGRDLMHELNVKGPAVGTMMESQLEWRLLHPQGSKEECLEYLRSRLS